MITLVTHFLGGLGLFLLGMWLLTEGLKLAAGSTLSHILGQWTSTRLRGLGAGIMVTCLVQSSSAVTVATIGFVNAGLFSFSKSLWVIFGSNVGTTMTSWLVALIGFKLKIESFALPLVGIGMLLHLTGEGSRRGALGLALAGFGTLFVGIDVLRQAFDGIGNNLQFDTFVGMPVLGILMPVLLGMLLTVLMQSSSAAMAIVLTASAGGLIPLATAAAGVIGVNVGTTITAVIAAIAATPAARRTAGAHVAFNLLTGIVALLLLSPLLWLIKWMTEVLALDPSPPTVLAAFHTVFNLLGVALMWPLANWLESWLLRRFRTADEDEGRAHHLDTTVLEVPSLAIDALLLEVQRLGTIARRLAADALAARPELTAMARDHAILERLSTVIANFLGELHQGGMNLASSERLPQVLRLLRHYETMGQLANTAGTYPVPAGLPEALAARLRHFHDDVCDQIAAAAPDSAMLATTGLATTGLTAGMDRLREEYTTLKNDVLQAGALATISVKDMDQLLERSRAARQLAEQATDAAAVTLALAELTEPPL